MTSRDYFIRRLSQRAENAKASSAIERWPSEARLKHLEFVQAIISRMANNSYITKGWSLTITAAIYGFAAIHLNPWIASVGFIPVIGFWWLDAWYLRQERLFRCLYDDIRQPGTSVPLFSMHIQIYRINPLARWRRVAFSATLLIFYGILMAAALTIFIAGIVHNGVEHTNVIHKAGRPHAARTSSAVSFRSISENLGLGGQIFPIRSCCQRGTIWICRWKIVWLAASPVEFMTLMPSGFSASIIALPVLRTASMVFDTRSASADQRSLTCHLGTTSV